VLACSAPPRPLSEAESAILREAGLDHPEVVAALESLGGGVERLIGLGEDGDPFPAPGVTFAIEAGRVPQVIEELRASLGALDMGVYHAEQNFGFEPDRVALVAGSDPYRFLDLVRVDGINFGLEHEDVVTRLRAWDDRYGLTYVGAGLDWVHAALVEAPDYDAFAREVYAFCPDVVDQGTGTVEALAAEMRRSRSVYCWWD